MLLAGPIRSKDIDETLARDFVYICVVAQFGTLYTVDYLIMHDTTLHKCHTAWNFHQPELGKAGEWGVWIKCAYYMLNTPKPQICNIKWALPYLIR